MKLTVVPCALALLCLTDVSSAANFAVNRFDDPLPNGCTVFDCSLREAVLAANANAGADQIQLAAGTYSLTRTDSTPNTLEADKGALWLAESTTMTGQGAESTRIRWKVTYKFYNTIIQAGYSSSSVVSLNQLTLSHGRGDTGGCIHMDYGSLMLNQVTVESCTARLEGGAMDLNHVDLTMVDSVLTNNRAVYHGGALNLEGTSLVQTSGSLIDRNAADATGGGVRIVGSPFIGLVSNVTWIDDGTSIISNNTAGTDGGGINVSGGTLQLSTASSAAVDALLTLQGNVAVRNGGGFAHTSGLMPEPVNLLSRVRLLGNRAANGGGAWSEASLHVSDSEVAYNVATTGNGGGIAMIGTPGNAAQSSRRLDRVGLLRNTASAGAGGGIYSECVPFEATNLSLGKNRALSSRGQQIHTLGAATLRHITSVADPDLLPAPGLVKAYNTSCAAGPMRIANSLIDDRCGSTMASDLVSDGGNQLGATATGCPFLSHQDQRQTVPGVFKLKLATFGAGFEVYGWNGDFYTRPQRNFGRAAYCESVDVRGQPRNDGACDAGAFEQ